MTTRILGIAASLRNARWGVGNRALIDEVLACRTEEELKQYLREQAGLHLNNFIESGRAEGLGFDQIYRNLQKLRGTRGLSNSEAALAAALWAAAQKGAEIAHVSLSEYFPYAEKARNLEELRAHLSWADGLLVSGPVYFGDRGSLAQGLVDLIREDPELKARLENRVYGGIAVGAKRNGGQETTLIYQLLDMVHAGLVGVGNDSDTTAQYGGTAHAGDVGTMPKDDYGLWTSMGAGRRIAHVATLMKLGASRELRAPLRFLVPVLQDKDGRALRFVQELTGELRDVEFTILDVTGKRIARCIACDICPTHVDVDASYRCIIGPGPRDEMESLHQCFIGQDAVIPVAYSPIDREGLVSVYQTFVERTRYLRRGDYLLGDLLTAPLVLEEIGAHENMSIRMVTSFLRHHTVVTEPMLAVVHQGRVLNQGEIREQFGRFVERARRLTAGRLEGFARDFPPALSKYNPVGYILSAVKDKEDEKLGARALMVEERRHRQAQDAEARLSHEAEPAPWPT
jgi:multimeric flavodoxin WrbA